MGLFGLFYGLFSGGVYGAKKITDLYEDASAQSKAEKNGEDTYWTPNGGNRLTANGRQVCKLYDHNNGDLLLIDLHNGKVYKNYTEEEWKKNVEKCKKHNKTVIDWYVSGLSEQRIFKKPWYGWIGRPNFVDIATKNFYNHVFINGLWFYMNLDTGHIVRLSDGTNVERKKGSLSIKEIIDTFNNYQDKIYQLILDNDDSRDKLCYYCKSCQCDHIRISDGGEVIRDCWQSEEMEQIGREMKIVKEIPRFTIRQKKAY